MLSTSIDKNNKINSSRTISLGHASTYNRSAVLSDAGWPNISRRNNNNIR